MQTRMRNVMRRHPKMTAGGFFGVWMAVWDYVDTRSVGHALVGGLLSVGIFGVLLGPLLARETARVDAVIGDLPVEDRAVVERAARRGPVPADPRLRAAAARLAAHRLDESRAVARNVLVFGLLTLFAVWGALTSSSPWWWLAAAVPAVLLVGSLFEPRRWERRLALLQGEMTRSSQG